MIRKAPPTVSLLSFMAHFNSKRKERSISALLLSYRVLKILTYLILPVLAVKMFLINIKRYMGVLFYFHSNLVYFKLVSPVLMFCSRE